MSCKEIHEELVNMEEVICPFCDKQISKQSKKQINVVISQR